MGSQTLDILRQGVWASLTGGWFYDSHQGVFCNVVHLYLWLFLLCTPFVAYLYFPVTWLTWLIYCLLSSMTVLMVKLINMSLHSLYDRAQSMSEANLKNPFFKVTKETAQHEDESAGIELKVLGAAGSRNSVEHAINEASEENSMMSMENVNSINLLQCDLRVDVHRKNSSESIDFMFYCSDQQSLAGSASVTKSIRSNNAGIVAGSSTANATTVAAEANVKHLTVYPEHVEHLLPDCDEANIAFKRQNKLLQKTSDLRRQSSLDAAAAKTASNISSKLIRNQSDSIVPIMPANRNNIFLHTNSKINSGAQTSLNQQQQPQRLHAASSLLGTTLATPNTSKSGRLQRHRSSETHDERLKHQNCAFFLPIHQELQRSSALMPSSSALGVTSSEIFDIDEHALIFGSSNVFIDDNCTKSDFDIEQLRASSSATASRSSYQQNRPQYHAAERGSNIRKDSNSTMSALQLPVGLMRSGGVKRRRHSNATSCYKLTCVGGAAAAEQSHAPQSTVRRIKSTALEVAAPKPSVSNLSAHPNSVEAINSKQQLNNPSSALLPPLSKCLVRNAHLNLCPKFSSSFDGSAGSLNLETNNEAESQDACGGASAMKIMDEVDLTTELQNLHFHGSSNYEDDDDMVDDVPQPRRHNPQGCFEHAHRAESDEGDILADDDVFRDFDGSFLDNILDDLQQVREELNEIHLPHNENGERKQCTSPDDPKQIIPNEEEEEAANTSIVTQLTDNTTADDDEEAAATAAIAALQQSLHSTDSETENNAGSRSPLLSGKKWQKIDATAQAVDIVLRHEIADIQRRKHAAAASAQQQKSTAAPLLNQDLVRPQSANKIDVDSGCPSSDCEQLSATSKYANAAPVISKSHTFEKAKDIESGSANTSAAGTSNKQTQTNNNMSKNLGAIPKVVKYREIDEMRSNKQSSINAANITSTSTATTTTSASEIALCSSNTASQLYRRRGNDKMLILPGTSKNGSRTSSSTSSQHSMSADSLSTDIHKMLWLMHGGAVDERGRPLAIGVDPNHSTSSNAAFPVNMSSAHFQFYQEALAALNTNKIRRNSKQQISEAGNNSSVDLINDEHNSAQTRVNNGGGNNGGASSTAAAILIVDGHHIENYCDYWRPPACMLSADKPVLAKSFYKYRFKCFGFEHEFKITMDRLELLALFDRDLHWLHILLSVLLCASVSYLGATILQIGHYKDLFAFLFCIVIAGSQYSLLKSVQPDAASPIHGFNKTVAYSRAIYFSVCAVLLLLLEHIKADYLEQQRLHGIKKVVFFGVHYVPLQLTNLLLELMYILLLSFPLIFSLGLFPQINTFLMYFLEQIDMHVFGGNAVGSLLASFLCVLRSMIGIMLLYGPLYAALAERRGTQFFPFSIFCAILIPLGYHLSRSASDFSHLWALIKHCIMSSYRDDDDDELSASSQSANERKTTASTRKVKAHKYNNKEDQQKSVNSNEHIEMCTLGKNNTLNEQSEDEQMQLNALERKSNKSKPLSSSSLDSSSQTLAKTMSSSKRAITASNSYASMAATAVDAGSSNCALVNDIITVQDMEDQNEVVATAAVELETTEQAAKLKVVENKNRRTKELEEKRVMVELLANKTETDDKVSCSSTTNAGDMSTLTAAGAANDSLANDNTESPDPLPKKLQSTVNARLKNDLVVMILLAVIVLGLHSSTVFTVLQPELNVVLYGFISGLGLLLHWLIPQMRKHMPWLCFARPILRQKEHGRFEVSNAPKIMWFEKIYIYLCLIERNVMFPLLVISALTADTQIIANKFGVAWGTLIVAICAMKFIRNAYSDPTNQYLIILFTVLLFRIDFAVASETFLLDYFVISLAFRKCSDFLLKLQFIVTYIAPWQITWGSAFHAFAQPFSVPHSAMLFLQAAISAILSTPLNPFLGSAIFLTSYVRPIKFWERDYNTRRIDHSNTRLSSQLERDLGADDNNLNSIFYEHLTRSLQHSLCGDLLMGRWGNVNQGDCFVLASDYLNCLVHIIELGNGLCTFQMRGLEFRGTYCQQREVEAITEDVEDNDGCCCCDPGHLPHMLSANAMFSTRWLAWQVVAAQYVLEGYSISDNLANATLQVFEYRKVLITYYMKSIIYYVVKSPKLEQWLASAPIQDALHHTLNRQFVDLDPIFNYNLDEDFDFRAVGITRASFCYVYLSWINYCYDKRKEDQNPNKNTTAVPTSTGFNDSKSTPNLSTTTAAAATAAATSTASSTPANSQSQQQLRTRPLKSATMSSSATVNNNHASTEHIATSQSFANISRQSSESVPGLTFSTTAVTQNVLLNNSNFNKSVVTVGNARFVPLSQLRASNKSNASKITRKEDSPPTAIETNCEKPIIKLKIPTIAKDSPIVSLCLALGLLARRSLATASHSSLTNIEFFLHGLHALFKGDFRITSPRDEWVFADMELLHSVVSPAVKMALKLQQDHISNPDEFLDPSALYEAIDTCSKGLVISHEADPVWRSAVLRGAPNLLALRHVMEDGSDEYRIIRLTKRFLSFRVIKLNRECVRGLWAGQQQELIYLRNRNPERGSIQNAKQALRNIINSSCDQPIGYPIYVSPLTTSYADTNEQLREVIGGPITPDSIKSNVLDWWQRIRERCRQGCSSGSALENSNLGIAINGGSSCVTGSESREISGPVYISAPLYHTLTAGNFFGMRSANEQSIESSLNAPFGSESLTTVMRNGLAVIPVKPTSTILLAGLLNREQDRAELRESRGNARKSHTPSTSSSRRATLPITSASNSMVDTNATSVDVLADGSQNGITTEIRETNDNSTSPRYAKMSCSAGNLGIVNIITTPGEFPRKTKGPISLTAAQPIVGVNEIIRSGSGGNDTAPSVRLPRIPLYKKVIIVDDAEIYDCLDLGRRIDVVWPSEEMRCNGGRMSWKDWVPRAGMVGHVVHYWLPNHSEPSCRSHVNRVVYLVDIGQHFVPVGEYGLQEYNQLVDSTEELAQAAMVASSRCSSMQRELEQMRQERVYEQREGLTPILASSLESPTMHLLTSSENNNNKATTSSSYRAAMKAVSSSSSSEEELAFMDFYKKRHEMRFSMLKKRKEQQYSVEEVETNAQKVDAAEHMMQELKAEEIEKIADDTVVVVKKIANPEPSDNATNEENPIVTSKLKEDSSSGDTIGIIKARNEIVTNVDEQEKLAIKNQEESLIITVKTKDIEKQYKKSEIVNDEEEQIAETENDANDL